MTRLFKKNIIEVITLKKFVTFNKVVIFKVISSNIQKSQVYNNKNKYLVLIQLLIIYQAYNINRDFYIWLPYKLISSLADSFDFIIKVIKLLHNMPKRSRNWFAAYYLH